MAAFDFSQVNEILLSDGWHTTTGAPIATTNPVFTGDSGQPVSTDETWVSFIDAADGKVYAFPVSPFIAVRYTP